MGLLLQRGLSSTVLCCLQAQDQLVHARRILGYSYVFAFSMFGRVMFADEVTPTQNAINQNLFEDQQQQLEHMVGGPLPQCLSVAMQWLCSVCCGERKL